MRALLKHVLAFWLLIMAPLSAHALVRVDVDLSSQTMTVRSGSGDTYVWPISSGRAGHLTPNGVFRPRAMYTMVYSAKYGNAPMPHSIFFYGQYAIHGTTAVGNLGHPASHGCIRLLPSNAAALFAMVKEEGAVIRVSGSPYGEIAHSGRHHTQIAHNGRHPAQALAFAPVHHARTLNQWAHNPLAR